MGVAASLAIGAVIVGRGGDAQRPASVGEQPTAGDASATAPAIAVPPSAPDATVAPTLPQASGTVAPTLPQASAAPGRERQASPATPAFGRKVQRAAQLTLTTSPAEVQDVADDVVKTTQSVGGVVQDAKISTSDAGGRASFTLRIPSDRLADAIRALSDLAHVGSLDQDATDITGSFVSAADRLSDARAERKALLRALARATTANEIASLRRRVRLNASEVAARKGELSALRRRANLSTVSVTITGSGKAKDDGAGGWSPGDAAADALRVLEVAVGVVLVALAVLAPLAILAAVAALGARATRRRRREAALDIG
jgi:hypothetical protein